VALVAAHSDDTFRGKLTGTSQMPRFNPRQFLQTSAAIGSLLASGMGRTAGAASEHIDTPVVDRVVIREIADNPVTTSSSRRSNAAA
jgi:hypothetical protein